MTDPA